MYSNKKGALMLEIISGKVSLYERTIMGMNGMGPMGVPSASTSIDYYVIKEGQQVAQYIKGGNLAYGSFQKNIREFFEDCKPLIEMVETKGF